MPKPPPRSGLLEPSDGHGAAELRFLKWTIVRRGRSSPTIPHAKMIEYAIAVLTIGFFVSDAEAQLISTKGRIVEIASEVPQKLRATNR